MPPSKHHICCQYNGKETLCCISPTDQGDLNEQATEKTSSYIALSE